MSPEPVYAIPGERFELGMVMPPGVTPEYGHAMVDDERSRHFRHADRYLPDPLRFHHDTYADIVFYVTDGNFGNIQTGSYPRGYLGYDGSLQDDPVNQWANGEMWMKACGVFASHMSAFRGDDLMLAQADTYDIGHALVHSDVSILRTKVTFWWGRALNGEACRQLAHYMPPGTIVNDPEIGLNPIITATTPADENWKIAEATIAGIMAIICDDCQGFNILRRFQRKCQPLEFLTSLNNGMVIAPDFSEDEWRPRSIVRNFSFLNRADRIEIHNELMEWNGRALTYFDENIAPDATHL